ASAGSTTFQPRKSKPLSRLYSAIASNTPTYPRRCWQHSEKFMQQRSHPMGEAEEVDAAVEKIIELGREKQRAKQRRKQESAQQGEPEPPRPLMRELPPPDPFPIDALGGLLANTAIGIQDRTRAPIAICGQSVMAATTLAVQAHAN